VNVGHHATAGQTEPVSVDSSNPTDPSGRGLLAGRLCVLGAALLWSTSGLFVKAPIFDDWPEAWRGALLAFWRATFAVAVLLPAVRRPRWRPGLAPLCIAFVVMNATFLTSMSLTTAANATWLQATAPWWVFVITGWLVREPIARRELVPLGFAVLGVGIILGFGLAGGAGSSPAGVLSGLVSGASFAGVIVAMRRLREENPVWLVAICHLAAAASLGLVVLWRGVWPSAEQLVVLAAFGAVQMAAPYLLMVRGLRTVGSQEAVGLGLVEPIILPLWVFLVWGETPAWWTLAGAALILAGLLLRYAVIELWMRKSPF